MKNIFIVLALLFVSLSASAQKQDVAYLKNGSVVRGVITDLAGGKFQIKTIDGSVFVYDKEEVDKITKEEAVVKFLVENTDEPKTIFRPFVGVNLSNENVDSPDETSTPYGLGFNVGCDFEVAISKNRRWYFGTGASLEYCTSNQTTETSSYYHDYTIQTNLKYMKVRVPAIFSYKIPVVQSLKIVPSLGLHCGVGIWGKMKESYESRYDDEEETNLYDYWDSFYWGFNCGLAVQYKKISCGVSYKFDGDPTNNIHINVGYQF